MIITILKTFAAIALIPIIASFYVTYAEQQQVNQLYFATDKLAKRLIAVKEVQSFNKKCSTIQTTLQPELCLKEQSEITHIENHPIQDVYKLGQNAKLMNYGLEEVKISKNTVTMYISGVDVKTYRGLHKIIENKKAMKVPDLDGRVKATQFGNGSLLVSITFLLDA